MKKTDENELYAGEWCQIIDNSENKSTYSEDENHTYKSNNIYETMIEFKTLRKMCTRICMMKRKKSFRKDIPLTVAKSRRKLVLFLIKCSLFH